MTASTDLYVKFVGLTKRFGTFTALDKIDLDVTEGTIHAILGENGAGKSTLMNLLYGLYQPNGGHIFIRGDAMDCIPSPKKAIALGIGMIHQHFMQVETLSVAENIILGLDDDGFALNLKKHEKAIAALAQEMELPIDPKAKVGTLSMGMRQRVEILKALYRKARLLIFDEPTSVLAPEEIKAFLASMKTLRSQGCTTLFITHKLGEVMEVADDVTVMRLGKIVDTRSIKDATPEVLATFMVGHAVEAPREINRTETGKPMLELSNVSADSEDAITPIKDISFTLHAGEILGIAGVDGNGQNELAEIIAGLLPASSGTVKCEGRDITSLSLRQRKNEAHIRYVPGDRQGVALVQDYSCTLNMAIRDFKRPPFSTKWGFLKPSEMNKYASKIKEKYDVRLRSLEQKVRFLSGGNQQKLVLGREIEGESKVLIVMQPCKGLDIGAIDAVHELILQEREKGTAVLYISTELEHVLQLSDRIGVMACGELINILERHEATSETIGMCMAGLANGDA